MRRVRVSLFLFTPCLLLLGLASSRDETLQPLPIARTSLPQAASRPNEDSDLQRAGYVLDDGRVEFRPGDGRERTYSLRGRAGSSLTLVDREYPAYALQKRKLVFEMSFWVKESGPRTDRGNIPTELVGAAEKAAREDQAVVAGLAYLAAAAETATSADALQAAVVAYVQKYHQPGTPLREACSDCGPQFGFGDEYYGGPELHFPLDVPGAGWTIAGIRHYLNGESLFTVEVTATIPKS